MMRSSAIPQSDFPETILHFSSSAPVPYPLAIAAMERATPLIKAREIPEFLWFLEHPRLYSAGISAREEDLFNPESLPTYHTGRGGQWTYHGPGQRIVYVMLDLANRHGQIRARDVHAYVHGLEEWLITALKFLGVTGERRKGRVGIWVCDPKTGEETKIAAIGVRITRWISWHGIALNVAPHLNDFKGIVPCGLAEYGVTSLEKLGASTSLAIVDEALAKAWTMIFGSTLQRPNTAHLTALFPQREEGQCAGLHPPYP